MDIYREIILEHYKDPQYKGHVSHVDRSAHVVNPSCGDELTFEFQLGENGTVEDVRFSGQGCAISQASADLMAGEMIGKTKEELEAFSNDDVFSLLGGPVNPGREKCATLVLKALEKVSWKG